MGGGGGGGGNPLYMPYRFVPPQRIGLWRSSGLKMGIDFGLESGMAYEGTTVVYQYVRRFNSK